MRAIAVGTLIALLAGVNACGPAVQTGPKSPGANGTTAPVHPVAVSDADFAASTYQVLISGERNPKRTDLLVGVVQRQLERAKQRFDSGHAKAGLAALTGALYLVRTGELHAEMFEHASDALSDGAREVARVGNEGRAFALYKTLERVLPPGPQRKDVEGHLAALAKWDRIAAGSGPMQAAGSRQRTAIERALFAPSKPTMDAAHKATVAWVQKALSFNAADVPIRSNFDREEAIEAYHAIRAGGAALVALYLRNGDAAGALDAVDKADLSRVVPPGLSDRLQRAAEDDDPAAWTDLYHLFQSAVASERPETGLDADLARAAAWGSALELYRSQPGSPQAAMALAGLMLHYGMAEAAPLVLAGALGSKPSANDLGSAMALVLQAMIAEDDIGQHAAVRRAFAAARPILRLAESKQMVGRVRPSAARLHYVMGALETQAGALAQARPELEASVKEQPSVGCYKLLAAIDRQRGSTDQALESLKQVIQLAAKTGDRADEADAWLSTFEIERDKGQSAKARSALATALVRALDARKLAHSLADQAVAERLLARILDLYGNTRAARHATERAYEASRSNRSQLAATILDAARRALLRDDLGSGRKAVQKAVDASLDDEDLVYAALWLKLLEEKLKVSEDGTVEQAFDAIDESSYWPTRLRDWARGRLDDKGLLAAAKNPVQQTEAKFYVAMQQQVSGDSAAALPRLEEVAKSPAIELVEVAIARDVVSKHRGSLGLQLPSGVQLP
jgi:tetratricopeptide (TPR) repeat protein